MITIDSQAALINIIQQGVVKAHHFQDLSWADIEMEGLIFEDCTFADNQFSSAILKNLEAYRCQFSNCKFNHTNINEAIFDTCSFYDVKIDKGTDFSYANLKHAKFLDCDLSQASFKYSEAFNLTIKACKGVAADFEHANFCNKISPKVIFAQAEIIDSIMRFSRFAKTYLAECKLSGNDFTEADFNYANLSKADLKNCILNGASLTNASLEEAEIQGSELNNIDLTGCTLKNLLISTDQCIPFLNLFGIEVV